MIHTVITPGSETVSFSVPKEYIGKEIEIIAFARGEGAVQDNVVADAPSFTVFHVNAENYKFNRDEVNER